MQRKVIATLVGALFSVGIAQVQAQTTPYYNPANAASPTGVTTGAELTKTIGCPGKGLLDNSCQAAPVVAPAPVVKPAPAPAPVVKAAPAPVVSNTQDSVMYIPTGVRSTSALMIERMAPTEVVAGQPFSYDIKATNLTPNKLNEVVVQDLYCACQWSGFRCRQGTELSVRQLRSSLLHGLQCCQA